MNRKQFLNIKNIIENIIISWFKKENNHNMEGLKITRVKIYKYLALVEYRGGTFCGFKLINLKTFNIINCKITVLKKILIDYPGGASYPGYIKNFTNSYNNTLKLLLNCKKSNDNIKIYNFKYDLLVEA